MNLLDQFEVLLHECRSQAHRRLVHQEDPGAGHECTADGHHLLLAARQRARLLGQAFLHPREKVVDLLHVLDDAVLVVAKICAKLEVLLDRQPLEEATVLRDHGDAIDDPVAGRLVVDNLAVQDHLTRGRRDHAQQGLQRRGLARSVAAQQTDQFSRVDGQVHVLEDVDGAVVGVDLTELQECRGPVGRTVLGHRLASTGRPR